MGFNISQIINKLLPTQEQGAIGWENPYLTPQGQIEVGNSESLLQYYSRKGLLNYKGGYDIVASTAGSFTTIGTTSTVKSGKIQYAQKLVFSADNTGLISIQYFQDDGTARYIMAYISAKQPFIIELGGVWSADISSITSNIQVLFRPDIANTKCAYTLLYVEV